MLRLKKTSITPFFLNTITSTLYTQPKTIIFFQYSHISKHQYENKDETFLPLLLKNPPIQLSIQQFHSHLLTNGFLNHPIRHLNILLRHYSLSGSPHLTFFLYFQLQQIYYHSQSIKPPPFDSFTYTPLINATTSSSLITTGTLFHSLIIKVGFQFHVYVQTALMNMYSSFGVLGDAFLLFDEMPDRNSVSWNVMITGLVKWGELEFARSLFDEMPDKTVVSWTGIIDGYVRKKKFSEGLCLFRRMVSFEGISPTEITILSILPAIYNMGELRDCQLIHGYVEKRGFNASDIRIANSILDTYAKCGCIVSASRFFEEICVDRKNLVSWTSFISGFAMHGMGKEAVEVFERMEKAGLKPNRVTLLSVLNACSHGGLVEEGLKFFEKMVNEYGISPDIKHYGCLVDMLGRTGRLEEAEKLALGVPAEIVNVVIWRTLLGACSFHGNIEMGERVTRKIMEMERGYGGDYVLMHNLFVGVGRFKDAERLRRLMEERNAFKVPGHSSV
ncbi:Pentatricopeptide repeat (PPR) superfamily protein [Euphorbia peplus]|nr:Pentatricopeptide repeat (PPR) superfamily protein [Euphorbia peplus]